MDSGCLVFRIDRFRSHRFFVNQIVDVSALLVKDPDIPGNSKIVIAAAGAGGQGPALLVFLKQNGLFGESTGAG